MSDRAKCTEQIAVRLPPQLAQVLEFVAAEERRSVSNVVRNVLQDWSSGTGWAGKSRQAEGAQA